MKYFFTTLIIILLIFIGYLTFQYINKEEVDDIIIIPEKKYSYYYEEDIKMEIPFFVSDLSIVENIGNQATISNVDNTIKLLIDEIEPIYLYNYIHENVLYYYFELSFNLPELETSYKIDELYLNLEIELNMYSFFIGEINVYYDEETYYRDFFYWDYLQASKNDGAHISELIIGYSDVLKLDKVIINNETFDYIDLGDEIKVIIRTDEVIFDQTYIIFTYNDSKQIIKNFRFFYHYDILNGVRYRIYKLI